MAYRYEVVVPLCLPVGVYMESNDSGDMTVVAKVTIPRNVTYAGYFDKEKLGKILSEALSSLSFKGDKSGN